MAKSDSHIGKIIDLIKDKKFIKAKEQCQQAKEEFKKLKEKINISDQKKIKCIDSFIDEVSDGKQKGINAGINTAWKCIETFYEEEERKLRTGQNKTDVCKSEGGAEEEVGDKRENALEPIHPRGMVAVATAFRELFDTEWTEAHEELDDDIDEKEKVQVLLKVVQKAYIFNKEKANNQFEEAERIAKRIVAGNESLQNVSDVPKGEKDFLVRYLYENAHIALPRLQKGFYTEKSTEFTRKWKQHFNQKGINFELNKRFTRYIEKCVEITWLLCIEEPPIHMSYGKTDETFNTKFYEPLTRTGKIIDYIVWPALVNKDMYGEILVKGKAEGK